MGHAAGLEVSNRVLPWRRNPAPPWQRGGHASNSVLGVRPEPPRWDWTLRVKIFPLKACGAPWRVLSAACAWGFGWCEPALSSRQYRCLEAQGELVSNSVAPFHCSVSLPCAPTSAADGPPQADWHWARRWNPPMPGQQRRPQRPLPHSSLPCPAHVGAIPLQTRQMWRHTASIRRCATTT